MVETRRKQILQEVVADLELLPEEQLEEARDFVELLIKKTAQPKRGSPEALLRLFGVWQGPPGELDHLLEEIYEARHQEES